MANGEPACWFRYGRPVPALAGPSGLNSHYKVLQELLKHMRTARDQSKVHPGFILSNDEQGAVNISQCRLPWG